MPEISLSVNLNKIALLRNSREGDYPSVMEFGRLALQAGAHGLTVHPRPDQRHIKPHDVKQLGTLVKTTTDHSAEFNIEGNPFAAPRGDYPGLIELALATQPDQCTLVPDTDNQKTSDHGFDLTKTGSELQPLIEQLHTAGIRVSLFMDPDPAQISLASELGADRIELYTGPFAHAFAKNETQGKAVFKQHCVAAEKALSLGLGINAGHDLNLENMRLYNTLPGLQEVSIGHALTVDALLYGFENTVKSYLKLCLN